MPRYKVTTTEKYRVRYEVDAPNEDAIHNGSIDLWNVISEDATGDDYEIEDVEELEP